MKSSSIVFVGMTLILAASWLGLAFAPATQLSDVEPFLPGETALSYPKPPSGLIAQGRQVFVSNGCVYCHTQQVRPSDQGNDLARGLGPRPTVPGDFQYESLPLLGRLRTGPDLTNVGLRRSDPNWHHLHLYNPRIKVPRSVMPSFKYLYEERKILGQRSNNALALPEGWTIAPGYEILPTDDAKALVAYVLSLNRSTPLRSATEPATPTMP